MTDQRSEAAKHWRRLYNTKQWRALRQATLIRDGYQCQRCKALLVGKHPAPNSPAVNHRQPHKGDRALFYDADNLQSLCKSCHDGETQSRERTGRDYDSAVGEDGMPIDPNHPWYGGQ